MADVPKVLAQSAPLAVTLTDAYTVPAATSAVISSFSVCNRGATPTTYRLSVAIAGAVDATKQYIAYDTAIDANDSFIGTLGIGLATTDVMRVYAGNANLSFIFFGIEII